MTTVADDNDTQDWVAAYDGKGQERVVRDCGDSGVVMIAVAVEDGSGRQQWQRQTLMVAEDTNSHTMFEFCFEYLQMDQKYWVRPRMHRNMYLFMWINAKSSVEHLFVFL
jgi:hypothetical protein